MTLQDLAFEGVYSYKRKIEFAESSMAECLAQRNRSILLGSDKEVVSDFEDMCKEWEIRLKSYERKYADALKLYEETFC